MKRPIVATAMIGVLIAVYLLRLDETAGLFVDDAWYMILAKAISEGQGFRIISSASGAFVPAVPPGFPAVLAPIWALWPTFPDNVVALKSVSIVAMFGIGLASFHYFARVRRTPPAVAAIVAALTVALPAFVFLATSTVMADVLFSLGQLLTVLAVERVVRKDGSSSSIALAGLIAGATLLVRTAGAACVVAGIGYLVSQRRWRATAIFASIVFASYLPWAAYAEMNHSSEHARSEHGGSIAFPYGDLLRMRYGGEADSGQASLAETAGRVRDNLGNVLGRDFGAILLPSVFRGPQESGQEVFGMSGAINFRATSMGGARGTFLLSMAFSAVMLAGLVRVALDRVTMAEWLVVCTVGMVCAVPALTFRYVLPLAPFVIFYFFAGLEAIVAALKGSRALTFGPAFRIAATCVALMVAAEHAQYIWAVRYGPTPFWLQDSQAVERLMGWLRQPSAAPGQTASNNPGLIYLWTGREGLSMGNAMGNWERWKSYGVRYAVAVNPAEKPPDFLGYRIVHESTRQGLWIVDMGASDKK